MPRRKRLKQNAKGQYTESKKVEDIQDHIDDMINKYVDKFSDVNIDDLQRILLSKGLFVLSMRRTFG